MTHTNELLDHFARTPSLRNAQALVRHVNRHSLVFSLLNEDQEGQLRNAIRILKDERRA